MKVYVAAHDRWAGLHVAGELARVGHHITSQWLSEPFGRVETYGPGERQRIASMDAADVRRSEALVLVAGPDRYPGGKFVEAGIAIGLGLKVVVIGRRENMLLWHPTIEAVDDITGAVGVLSGSVLEDLCGPMGYAVPVPLPVPVH